MDAVQQLINEHTRELERRGVPGEQSAREARERIIESIRQGYIRPVTHDSP